MDIGRGGVPEPLEPSPGYAPVNGIKKVVCGEQADKNEIKDSDEECIVRKPRYLSLLVKLVIAYFYLTYNVVYIEYYMESAPVRCLHTSCNVSEIERVSVANE